MSIQSEINRISENISDSLDEVALKGVTVPAGSNSDDLPGLIRLIEQSGGGSGVGGVIYQDEDGYLVLSEEAANVIGISRTLDEHGGEILDIVGVSLANDTVTPETLAQGVTAHNAAGEAIVGTMSGGGEREDLTIPKDVDFVDFDGRLLYSYTAAEFANLSELPANPSYPGLTAQGWNWTLADAKAFVAEYGALVIGQSYITDDGKTRIYVTIPPNFVGLQDGLNRLYITKVDTPAYTVDWGDGTTSDTASANYIDHTYSAAGDYVITIEVTSGTVRLGYQGANNTVVANNPRAKLCVTKVEIGSGVIGFGRNCFCDMNNLKSVSIPVTCNSHDTGTDLGWFGGILMTGIVFPTGTPGQDSRVLGGGTGSLKHLKYISIPKTMNGFRWDNSTYPIKLRKLIFPNYTTNATLYVYIYNVPSLTHFIVPGTYTTITTDRCRESLIKKLVIPATVTSIAQTAYSYNAYCEELHLLPTTPPTLANTNAFNQIGNYVTGGCIFYVPYSADHSILNAYQTATNWSTFASQMQEEPQ